MLLTFRYSDLQNTLNRTTMNQFLVKSRRPGLRNNITMLFFFFFDPDILNGTRLYYKTVMVDFLTLQVRLGLRANIATSWKSSMWFAFLQAFVSGG